MRIVTEIEPARGAVWAARRDGKSVGLVPTMGALHTGHKSLIQASVAACELTVVSIFVNPTQFGPNEDLAAYPRPFDRDVSICRDHGVGLLFAPTVETMYPGDERTTVRVAGLTEGLCGPHRPGHFDGVTTVVAKLFNAIPADQAFFGEKDYQQLQVIRRMVRDLNIPIEVIACPTVRMTDGLAMSSRNAYLSAGAREQAASLSQALFRARERVDTGERDAAALTTAIRRQIRAAGECEIDYVEIVDAQTLQSLPVVDRPARICLAVRIGGVRLIDNVAVDVDGRDR